MATEPSTRGPAPPSGGLATEKFRRPVGGRAMVRDAANFLRFDPELCTATLERRIGGSMHGPTSIVSIDVSTLEQILHEQHGVREQFVLRAEFDNAATRTIEITSRRSFTTVTIHGHEPWVYWMKRRTRSAIAFPRRFWRFAKLTGGTLAAIASVIALVLVLLNH